MIWLFLVKEAPLKVHCVRFKIVWSVSYTTVCNHLLKVILVYLFAEKKGIYMYLMWAAMFLPKPRQYMQQYTLLRNGLEQDLTCFFFLLFIFSLILSI